MITSCQSRCSDRFLRVWRYFALVVWCGLAGALPLQAADLIPIESTSLDIVTLQGDYRALLIGIDDYEAMPKLKTAVNDVTELRQVLIERYGFKPDRIRTLLNKEATRSNIETSMVRLIREAAPVDSILIYYAGHGQYGEDSQLGWWVPVEGKRTEEGTWILDAAVRNYVASMRAKHVYLIADSCFSGALFAETRGVEVLPRTVGELLKDKYYSKLYAKKSRWGLTSGGTEPVADKGLNGHSMFAYHFLKYLKESDEPYLIPSRIADQVIPLVARNAEQMPRSQPLQGANDEGGQFVLRLVSVAKGLEEQQRRATDTIKNEEKAREDLKRELDRLAEERKRMEADAQQRVEAERKKRQELERQLEDQRKQEAEVRTRLEEEHRQRVEAERQKNLGAEQTRLFEQQRREEEDVKRKLDEERQKRADLERKLTDQRASEQEAKRAVEQERELRLEAERIAQEAQSREPGAAEVGPPKKGRRVYPGGF